MALYIDDRRFTDFIHSHLAVPTVYSQIGWTQQNVDNQLLQYADINHAIDYVFDCNGRRITVQERFRDIKYQKYNDFTIRYRRDLNPNAGRVKSEYYKMAADYFTYGITDCAKEQMESCREFVKVAIIDMHKVYEKIDAGKIYVVDNRLNFSRIMGDCIECPIKYNRDGSSSFFPIDIRFLVQLWGNEMVIFNKGF
ncbi:MAG: hypothetical protein J6Y82_10115 [Bacteroidales bacterium]|nr:hypothetical protein [Bacteroidales bacterium]